MKFRLPFLSNHEQAKPLKDLIDFAAHQTGLDTYKATLILSYFLEGIADQLTLGQTVRFPGFGVFAPYLDDRSQYRARRTGPVCVPRFSPARGFRAQVMTSAPANDAGKRNLENHRRNHSVSARRPSSSRVFLTLEHFRADIARQLGEDPLYEDEPTYARRTWGSDDVI